MIALLALLALQDPTFNLGVVEVRAKRSDTLVTVVVNDDAPEEATIISAPVGIRCGARRFEYSRNEAPRLCWTRDLPGTAVHLSAKAPQSWGSAWRVEWSGCETSDSRGCDVALGRADVQVEARFIPEAG